MPRALLLLLLCAPTAAAAQSMTVEDYDPRSTLVVPAHPVTRARFPFIDVHAHPDGLMPAESLDALVRDMDRLNMAVMVNLSGRTGERLQQIVEQMQGRYPGRFVLFANLSFDEVDAPDYGERAARRLEDDVRHGAQGLKIFKNLGMWTTDSAGRRIATDDPRFDPVWAKCAELGIPVLIHTGDPSPFWEPHDRRNERWLELTERPNRTRPPEPTWEQIMHEQWNVFRRHPRTTFIAAHLAWLGNDLARLGRLFDELPNMHAEIGAVLAELGRQPRYARAWLIRYQDRVLFGKDAWSPEEYHVYFRTLETTDEYFDYYRKRHAFWKLYGLDLPDTVLRKLYYANALRLIPGIDRTRFAVAQSEPGRRAVVSEAGPGQAARLPYDQMAARIVAALQPAKGERAIVRSDPALMPELASQLARVLRERGVTADVLPYGPIDDFDARLARASIYVWLPAGPAAAASPEQSETLGRWLDAGRGRQIHFHWGSGTMAADGFPGAHGAAYDRVYVDALDVDYRALDRRQEDAIAALRSGEVRVTTPAGTDVRFRVGDRPFNKQNGDASRARMGSARIRIDREIELPAGVLRVAPIERSVRGTLVVPRARFGDTEVRDLRLTFEAGRVTAVSASAGEAEARAALDAAPALRHFREFGLGFNSKLVAPPGGTWLPYYGYGAGVVRLSLGDNSELGGAVTGGAVRWFFFTDATVTVGDQVVVQGGRLAATP